MHANQKIKISDWCMEIETALWIAVDFECVNIPLESASESDSLEQLLRSKPIAVGYGIVKKS